jgi:ATP-dependent Clp protease adaptor protein ClpS
MSTITEKKSKSKVEEILSSPFKIILHNDDYNSFDWVIKCLIKICGHDHQQAEQCANIVHFNGKCDVKWGDYDKLSLMKEKLSNAGLSVTMESN